MTRFSVWAPNPGSVELEVAGSAVPLAAEERGWRSGEAEAAAGSNYRYRVDGDRLPDPRSRFQPQGVHGPSALVDQGFAWSDAGWSAPALADLVIYELHVGTFAPEGTFDGVAARLDHLVELGVNAIELMPVAEFAGDRGWGYDGVDLYAPHHGYGGPEGLKRLVDACHARGLAVILDVVYNHLGPEGNYLSRFAPYFTDRYQTPWGPAINFDGADSDLVRDFFVENAAMWLADYHVDALRLDAVHAIFDMSAEHFLEELRRRLPADRPLIAESDLNDPRLVTPVAQGGYGLDAQWSDDFHHALHAVLTGERSGYYAGYGDLEHLATALRRAYVYAGEYAPHRRRRHGRPHSLSGNRFLAYAQNHDQVGNRARGERLSMLVSPGRLRIAAALVLCSPFVPLIFMGEEWAASTPFLFFSSHTDPGIARATTEGRIKEFEAFGWKAAEVPDPQDPASFERSQLRWEERLEPGHAEMLGWYRELIQLRRERPELRDGRLDQVDVRVEGSRLVMRRGQVTVACDLARDSVEVGTSG
ncbi:MAG TPA: malto-oligosyltrehalose trehalohydrolase [Candidatus Dormibacteraeota bacterium]